MKPFNVRPVVAAIATVLLSFSAICAQQPAFKDSDSLVRALLAAIRLRVTLLYPKQHPDLAAKGAQASRSGPNIRCPASLVGLWVNRNDANDGVLSIDEKSITGGALAGFVIFSTDCSRILTKEDGSISFTAKGSEALFTSEETGDVAVHPTVTISKRDGALLLEVSGFSFERTRGLGTDWNPQTHELAYFSKRPI